MILAPHKIEKHLLPLVTGQDFQQVANHLGVVLRQSCLRITRDLISIITKQTGHVCSYALVSEKCDFAQEYLVWRIGGCSLHFQLVSVRVLIRCLQMVTLENFLH